MSILQTITYDNAANLTFDSSKVEVDSGVTKLKLGYTAITPFPKTLQMILGLPMTIQKRSLLAVLYRVRVKRLPILLLATSLKALTVILVGVAWSVPY